MRGAGASVARVRERRARAGALALVALAACAGACRCQPRLESAVDVPITIDDARKLHAPPGVVVTVERVVTPAGGGSACGHSPLCVIVLPAILIAEMFPPKHDEVVIVERAPGAAADAPGVETYRASFTTSGDLLQARVQRDGVVRDLRQLRLEELGKRVVVEVARSPAPNAPPAPVPLAPQGDLLGAYARALDGAGGARCGRLLVEAYTWLGDEAKPFVMAHLAGDAVDAGPATADARARDPNGRDACNARVVEELCTRPGPEPQKHVDVVLAATRAIGPKTAEAGVACARTSFVSTATGGRVLDAAQARPFTRALVEHVCAGKAPQVAWTEAVDDEQRRMDPAWRATAEAESAACSEPAAAAWLALTLDKPVDEKALEAAVASKAWGASVVRELDVATHAPLLARALEDDDTDVAALEALHAHLEERRSAKKDHALTTGGKELAALYARGPGGMLCDGHRRRVQAAELLLALPDGERAAARAELARATQSDEVGALRRALGDVAPARLGPNAMSARRDGDGGSQCSGDQVAARVLFLGGCDVDGDAVVCGRR